MKHTKFTPLPWMPAFFPPGLEEGYLVISRRRPAGFVAKFQRWVYKTKIVSHFEGRSWSEREVGWVALNLVGGPRLQRNGSLYPDRRSATIGLLTDNRMRPPRP